MKHSIV